MDGSHANHRALFGLRRAKQAGPDGRPPMRLEDVMRLTTDRIVNHFRPRPDQVEGVRRFPFAPFGIGPQSFRAPKAPAATLARLGDLEVRLAVSKREIRRAQRLRYQVFYREMRAVPSKVAMMVRRDEDQFDAICDHVLVLDHSPTAAGKRRWTRRPRIVGTYRLLRGDVARRNRGFYTQGEYDIAPLLLAAGPDVRVMELGRSCVMRSHRSKRTLELLWQGVWNYARAHRIDVMIGCASFEGADPSAHALGLSFLHHHASAGAEWRARAHDHLRVDMDMMPKEAIDAKAAIRALPPLIKGYLRLGATIGDGAVIDRQFGTTDVFVVMPVASIRSRYFAHFGAPDALAAAPEHAAPVRLN
jgi:putative hemolysin